MTSATLSARLPDTGLATAPLAARYAGAEPRHALTNPVIDLILSRRSIRHYTAAPLPDGALEAIVAAAQSAASSSNLQAFSIVAVTDPARKARLNALAGDQSHIARAPVLLVWIADLGRLRAIATDNGQPGDGLDYLESVLIGVIDAALAAQSAAIAIESLGLGSCFIGALRNDPVAVAAELGLPAESFAVFGLTVGIPDPAVTTAVKPRLPQQAIVHREVYSSHQADAELSTYNERLRLFQAGQGMRSIDWTRQVADRVGTAAALKGRHRVGTALRRLGLKLA
ncbi:Nitroreductase [Devosia enhydra]|uniref:Nitroreductase n=1 Tax=Devosia enhydra TaxID=665118 RepID=A0A1K2HTB4_9HYPH|nr:nitroreductase family protein [Devosia enhydra]SFZ81422.1 Nitroreductase [Devosia enhydra]